MFAFALATAAVFLAFRLWTRIQAMEATIDGLNDRLTDLENRAEDVAAKATARVAAPAARTTPPPETPVVVRPPVPAIPPTPAAHVPAATPPPMHPVDRPAVAPPVRPSPIQTPAPPAIPARSIAVSRSDARDALETRIGSRWLLYIGVVAIIIGVSYFEKLAIENQWIGERTRIIQGTLIGLGLVVAGLRFVRAGYRLYGQVMSGSGIAILYVSAYAAFNFYHLITQPAAFVLMSGVTLLAAWLADRQRSQSLALVAVGGGFATPFLVSSGTDAQIALFGYETILIAGTMLLSRRRDWPTLNVVSYGFTVLTVGGWADRFYTSAKYIPTELFLTLFCAMFMVILRETRHSQHASAKAERTILWTAPFGYYFASLGILAPHSTALLIYLVLLALLGVVVSANGGAKIRLAFWFAVAAPLLVWSGTHGGHTWLAAGLAVWSAVYLLNLAGLLKATIGDDRRFAETDIALLHLNGLAAYGGAYLLIEQVRSAANAPLAAVFAIVQGILAVVAFRRQREEALHFMALGFTLLTIAIALQFDGAWITSAWAAEGTVVIWLGLRERRAWLRRGGLFLFGVAVARLLALQFAEPHVGQLLLLNQRTACALFIIALTYVLTLLHHRLSPTARRAIDTGIGLVTANLLLLALATSEIVAHWLLHTPPPFEPAAQIIAVSLIAGAATMWIGLVRRQEWIRTIGAAIVALAVFGLFSVQIERAPLGYVTVLNGRAAAGLFAVLMLYGLAALHRRIGEHLKELPVNLAVFITAASLLTLSLLTSEIDAFWAARGAADVWSITREGLQAMAWAVVGGFLVWQGLSNRRGWVRGIGGVLVVVATLRLINAQFAAASAGYVVLINARVIASLVVVAVFYGLARLYRDTADVAETQFAPHTVLSLMANVLTLTLLTSEITAYWQVHDVRLSESAAATSHFAREMMLSITWALYATVLIVVGLRKRYAPIRYFAIAVFVVTIVKVFAIDLAELDRIYRVLSVVGLGVTLLVTSYLYQRSREAQNELSG
jgi:uncharacterized membrane protein